MRRINESGKLEKEIELRANEPHFEQIARSLPSFAFFNEEAHKVWRKVRPVADHPGTAEQAILNHPESESKPKLTFSSNR